MSSKFLKFFRVSTLPTTGGVVGALYFVHNAELGEGKGKLYICTAENSFEDYTGMHAHGIDLTKYVEKTMTIAGIDHKDNITAAELVSGLKSQIDNAAQDGKFITGFTVNEDGKLVATYADVEITDTTYTFGEGTENGTISVTPKGGQAQNVTVHGLGSAAYTDSTAYDAAGTAKSLIEALDYSEDAVEGQYVSKVEQVDGKITVTRAALPTESADVDSIDNVTGAVTLKKGQTETGKINLSMNGKEMQAELVGSFENGAQVNKVEGVTLNGTDVVGEDKIARITAIEGIVKDDKVLSKSGNNIMSTLSLDYETQGEGDAAKKYIVLKGIDGVEIDKIDASDFIADSFLDDVEIVKVDGKDTLKFTWSMADGSTKTDSVDLSQYINIYTGVTDEVVVSAENVIGLANKDVAETTGTALIPAHGGSFNVVTDVTYDTKGRIAGVETTQVTLPTISEGDKTGSDDYVSVQVKTVAGAVSEVVVNTDNLTTKIEDIEDEISENAEVTATALVDLVSRVNEVANSIPTNLGVMSVEKGTDGSYVTTTIGGTAANPTVGVQVTAIDATDNSGTGLATDAYVLEQVASAVAGKNVNAEGDSYVSATAANNKVTVAATEKLQGAVTKAETALQASDVKQSVEDNKDSAAPVSAKAVYEALCWVEF